MDTTPHHQAIILEKSTHTKNNHDHHQKQVTTSISPASPPSSPSHEFSFTISLHSSSNPTTPPSTTTTTRRSTSSSNTKSPNSNNNNNSSSVINSSSSPLVAIDLSPADDIFFHGHLLPLHLLSHLPQASPRSSTNSLDSFTLPITDFNPDPAPKPPSPPAPAPAPKPKSFSLFNKWKLTATTTTQNNHENYDADDNDLPQQKKKRARRVEMMRQVLKRYMRMVSPLLPFRRRGKGDPSSGLRRPPHYSFSGILGSTNTAHSKRPGHYSAPPSMRTSPSNSGLLVATSLPSSASDSTMEELHAAIQAAIAHCKNSIAHDKSPPPPSLLA